MEVFNRSNIDLILTATGALSTLTLALISILKYWDEKKISERKAKIISNKSVKNLLLKIWRESQIFRVAFVITTIVWLVILAFLVKCDHNKVDNGDQIEDQYKIGDSCAIDPQLEEENTCASDFPEKECNIDRDVILIDSSEKQSKREYGLPKERNGEIDEKMEDKLETDNKRPIAIIDVRKLNFKIRKAIWNGQEHYAGPNTLMIPKWRDKVGDSILLVRINKDTVAIPVNILKKKEILSTTQ